MAKRKPPLSDADLLEFSHIHLCYELSMFFETARRLGQITKGTDQENEVGPEQAIINAFYESFVLHFRNLAEFLCSEKPRHDDVVAVDFLTDPTKWLTPATSLSFKEARVRSNKELAHLTTGRLPEKSPKRNWPVRDLVLETTKLMEDFAKQASAARLHQCVSKILRGESSRGPDAPPTIPGSGSIVGETHSIVVPDDC